MSILEQVNIPCDGATLIVEDVLSGVNVYLQAPDGTRKDVVSIKVEDGQVTTVTNHWIFSIVG